MTDETKEALKLALYWIEGNGKYDAAKRIAQTIREALAEESSGTEQAAQDDPCIKCKGLGYYDEGHECDDGSMAGGNYVECDKCKQPDFIKHEVENAYDWSEWVCPDPESYLMKCCDCGLVHEAQFRVAKYKPAPSDECEVVSDPDLQAQFRMRRSEQWSPEDTAHRSGGLPMAEQTAQQQEPVAWINWCAATGKRSVSFVCESELASQPLYEGITQNTQYHYSKFHSWFDSELHRQKYTKDHPAYLAAQEAWNAANDAAQHRINRLNAEIEAWKVRFKIAEDALAKLNGKEQEPVAYGLFINGELSWDSEWAFSNEPFPVQFDDEECRPLYTSPPAQRKPWVGLTNKEIEFLCYANLALRQRTATEMAFAVEAKLKEKNA